MAGKEKRDLRQELADELVRRIEAGTAPWQKPWEAGEVRPPVNAITGKPYRGVNYQNLMFFSPDPTDNRWCTYKAAKEQGWQVREGSAGIPIEVWKEYEHKRTEEEIARIRAEVGPGKEVETTERRLGVRYYTVFHASRIDGIPPLERPARGQELEGKPDLRIDALAEAVGVSVGRGGGKAFYRPGEDHVQMPLLESFRTATGHDTTFLHELSHATGHEQRMNREIRNNFGDPKYAIEELRAEMSAAMTAAAMGIGFDPESQSIEEGREVGNSAAYLASWLGTLPEKDRKQIIVQAIKDAQGISDYLMERVPEIDRSAPEQGRGEEELERPLSGFDSRLATFLEERNRIRQGEHPDYVRFGDPVANAEYFVQNFSRRNPELARTWAAEIREHPKGIGDAMGLSADSILAIASQMESAVERIQHPQVGQYVRFEPHDPAELRAMPFSGRVLAALDTNTGDVRYHLVAEAHPDKPMAVFYGRDGTFREIDLDQAVGFDRALAPEAEKAPRIQVGDFVITRRNQFGADWDTPSIVTRIDDSEVRLQDLYRSGQEWEIAPAGRKMAREDFDAALRHQVSGVVPSEIALEKLDSASRRDSAASRDRFIGAVRAFDAEHGLLYGKAPEPLTKVPDEVRAFLGGQQARVTDQMLRGSEEKSFFSDKMLELREIIRQMPATYETDGKPDGERPVSLRYFGPNGAQWFIVEKDRGDPENEGPGFPRQTQAYGLADLGMGYPEMGYINIPEITRAGAELDYHFSPMTLLEVKREHYPELVREGPTVSRDDYGHGLDKGDPAVNALLDDPDWQVRARGIKDVIERMSARQMHRALEDPEPVVRLNTLFLAGKLGFADRIDETHARQLLSDPAPAVRGHAVGIFADRLGREGVKDFLARETHRTPRGPAERALLRLQQVDEPRKAPDATEKNAYERKIEARQERYRTLAQKSREQAKSRIEQAKRMADVIPFGQPILVGHHSEGRDRRYRARISQNFGKGFGLLEKAEYYERRADRVNTYAISADDPDAVNKLKKRVDVMKQAQERMKAANAAIRQNQKAGREVQREALVKVGFREDQAEKLLTPDVMGTIGFASYSLSNNNARIKRLEDRIQGLEKARSLEDRITQYAWGTVRENKDINRIQFRFNDRPDEDVRKLMKSSGFRWAPSESAWQRQWTGNAVYAARGAIQKLDDRLGREMDQRANTQPAPAQGVPDAPSPEQQKEFLKRVQHVGPDGDVRKAMEILSNQADIGLRPSKFMNAPEKPEPSRDPAASLDALSRSLEALERHGMAVTQKDGTQKSVAAKDYLSAGLSRGMTATEDLGSAVRWYNPVAPQFSRTITDERLAGVLRQAAAVDPDIGKAIQSVRRSKNTSVELA